MSMIVNNLKGRSSRLIRRDMPDIKGKVGLWHRSYFAGSVGGAPLEIIKQYVENQQTSERPIGKQKWKEFLKDVNKNI